MAKRTKSTKTSSDSKVNEHASSSSQANSEISTENHSLSSQDRSPKKRKTGVQKIQDRLDSLETTLSDLVPRISSMAEEYSSIKKSDPPSIEPSNSEIIPAPMNEMFIESDYSHHLIALFYTINEYTGQTPVISRRDFFDSLISTPPPPFLAHSMFAFAACYSNHSLIYPMNNAFSNFFSDSALKKILTSEPSIASIQALVLLSSLKIQRGDPTNAWYVIGHAVRFSQMLGLDRIEEQDISLLNFTQNLSELKTLWKLCCFVDNEISSIIGKPPLTKQCTSVIKPFEPLTPQIFQDGYILSCLSVLPPYVVSFLINFRSLLDLWNQVQSSSETLKSLRLSPADRISYCLALADQLSLWYQRLPEQLAYYREYFQPHLIQKFPFLEQILNLHVLFYRAKIALFQPFFEDFTDYLPYQDFTAIVRGQLLAANNMIRMLEDWADCQDNFQNTAHLSAVLGKFDFVDSIDQCSFAPLSNDEAPFLLSTQFFYPGLALILFINFFNDPSFARRFPEFDLRHQKRVNKQLDTLLDLLQAYPLWEGSRKIANKLLELLASIQPIS